MGGQCRKVSTFSQQYNNIHPQMHPAFGHIFYFANQRQKTEKAVKQVPCPNEEVIQTLRKRVEFAKQCNSSITLVQIFEYDLIDQHSQQSELWREISAENRGFTCRQEANEKYLLIHFQYFAPESCLDEILSSRKGQLQKMATKFGKNAIFEAKKTKMWDYGEIDHLPSQVRQIVNIFYQQIEVIRMIDHIIGAVYFLHHFGVPHSALRPQQILVDEDGRFILVDRQIFARKTNYQLARQYQQLRERGLPQANSSILSYLCPEYIPNLKNRAQFPAFNNEKADIFCVGLLALNMCLLDQQQPIFQYSSYLKSIKMNQFQLDKRIVRMKERYSQDFSDLLQKMLNKNPVIRIDFAQLIDELNPLLHINLEAIKKVHSNNSKVITKSENSSLMEETYEYGGGLCEQQLRTRLVTMQRQFQKVMNNRVMLFNRSINQCSLQQEQNKIFNKLQKIKTARSQMSAKAPDKKPKTNKQSEKRYISGKQLQQIVQKEYALIKSRRCADK